jgi:hypothetical protein
MLGHQQVEWDASIAGFAYTKSETTSPVTRDTLFVLDCSFGRLPRIAFNKCHGNLVIKWSFLRYRQSQNSTQTWGMCAE